MNENKLNVGQALLTAVITVALSAVVGKLYYEYTMNKVKKQLEIVQEQADQKLKHYAPTVDGSMPTEEYTDTTCTEVPAYDNGGDEFEPLPGMVRSSQPDANGY